jgi:Domain of unknown function (DUF4111)
MGITLEEIPDPARSAWTRLRDELRAILGDDLVAMWALGGTTAVDGPPRSADLDTCIIVRREPDERTASAIEGAQADIGERLGVDWDTWVIVEDAARGSEPPRHAIHPDRRDTSWAINRGHMLAGHYVQLHGFTPAEVVQPPTQPELGIALDRELEHLEAHVAAGDTDPYEATYAVLNGSRIVRALETGDVAISKRAAGRWALEHLPDRWHPTLRAAGRAYDGTAGPEDVEILAADMAPFVAMVRDRLPAAMPRPKGERPRWSGS